MVFITLKQSKTDQLRKGITIVLGRTNKTPLCPVSALLSYLVVRGMVPGPLFVWSDGQFLTRAHFVREVKQALELAGADASDFNGHSFRIGAASTAAANGIASCPGSREGGGGKRAWYRPFAHALNLPTFR